MKTAKPTVRYRTQQSEETRQTILQSACKLASSVGLQELTLGRLAKKTGMSRSGLFAHFGSVEELQRSTVIAAREFFIADVVRPALAEPRGIRRLSAMLDAWLVLAERDRFRGGFFYRAFASEILPEKVREEAAVFFRGWIVLLEDEVQEAIAQGRLSKGEDASQLVFELQAFVQGAQCGLPHSSTTASFDRAREAIVARITRAAG